MLAYSKKYSLTLVSLLLVAIHLVVSFIFIFRGFQKDKLSGSFWVVSFLVCLTVLILLSVLLNEIQNEMQTPCPLQLSYPSNSPDRTDIEKFIADMKNKGAPLLDYDKKRTYVVLTGYYLDKLRTTSSTSPYKYIPVAYDEKNVIYALNGMEIWPTPAFPLPTKIPYTIPPIQY